jgi:hypothetical protein
MTQDINHKTTPAIFLGSILAHSIFGRMVLIRYSWASTKPSMDVKQ